MKPDLVDPELFYLIIFSTDLATEVDDENKWDKKVHNNNIIEEVIARTLYFPDIVGVIIALVDKCHQILSLVGAVFVGV